MAKPVLKAISYPFPPWPLVELAEVGDSLGLPLGSLEVDHDIEVLTEDRSGGSQRLTLCIRCIMRPTIGPYAGASLPLRLLFPLAYPWEGPRVVCTRRLWHPAVDPQGGALCLNILRLGWSPVFGLSTLLLGIWLVFQVEPDAPVPGADRGTSPKAKAHEDTAAGSATDDEDGALNQEASLLLKNDPKEFATVVALTLHGGTYGGVTYDDCMDARKRP